MRAWNSAAQGLGAGKPSSAKALTLLGGHFTVDNLIGDVWISRYVDLNEKQGSPHLLKSSGCRQPRRVMFALLGSAIG